MSTVTLTTASTSVTARPVFVPTRQNRALLPSSENTWQQKAVLAALASASGLVHAIGWVFPGAWWAAWIAQTLTSLLAVSCRPRAALAFGTLGGAIGIAASFHWGLAALRQTFDATFWTSWIIFAGLVALEALAFGLYCYFTSLAAQKGVRWLWLAPCIWAAIEFWYPRVFPWKLGYTQLEVLPLIQIAELLGATSIGFVMTAVTVIPALWLLTWRSGNRLRDCRAAVVLSTGALIVLAATIAFGAVRVSQWNAWSTAAPKLKLALIQVDPAYQGAERKLLDRSLAIQDKVDLICWPESSLGIYSEALPHFRDPTLLAQLSRGYRDLPDPAAGIKRHLLAGGKLYRANAADNGPYSMTGFLIGPQQNILGRYKKRTLMPFGEYIPGQQWWPAIREYATIHDVIEAGADPAPVEMAHGQKLGLVICYEDTLPHRARATTNAGAQALFSLIQGTAFENPLTLVQHQRLAALRAVENRRYFVRCASTGVSCIIEPTGRIASQLPVQVEATLAGQIAPTDHRTLYSALGDFFPLLCTALIVAALVPWRRKSQLAISPHGNHCKSFMNNDLRQL